MKEEELRAVFQSHENQTPDLGMLRDSIDNTARQRRRRRTTLRLSALAAIAAVALLIPWATVRDSALSKLPIGAITSPAPEGEVNLLLLGLDNTDPKNTRSDSITWVHIPASRARVYLFSIERDVAVELKPGTVDKVNSAYFYGGAELTKSVVEKLIGKKADGVITVTNKALADVVDAVGGIEVCLERKLPSLHMYHVKGEVTFVNEHVAAQKGYEPYVHQQGCHQYSGRYARDLVRIRKGHGNGAYGRDQTGQKVMFGLATKATNLDVSDFTHLLTIGGIKAETNINLPALAMQLRHLQPSNVVGIGNDFFYDTADSTGLQAIPPQLQRAFVAMGDGTLDQWLAEAASSKFIQRGK